jgi:putative SOS response-associated peptidase YedK
MPTPTGFTFVTRKNGEGVISHHGRVATVLRGERAATFLRAVATSDPQQVMARATGNYKRGNERA